MHRNRIISDSGASIKVCSPGDFEHILEWVRKEKPNRKWREVMMKERCYIFPDHWHYIILRRKLFLNTIKKWLEK